MSKVKLSSKEVKHVAKLAKLELGKKEIKKFQNQLSEILGYITQLNNLKTDKVKPTSQTTGLENVFKTDEVLPSLSQKEAVSQAKSKQGGFIKVKAVFEEVS